MEFDVKIDHKVCAVKEVCAWPNLQLLKNDELLVTVFNKPSHGLHEGELDCYSSEDAGNNWRFKGRPCCHEPGTIRMNCAVGYVRGTLIIACAGWSWNKSRGKRLSPWICLSGDYGTNWEVIKFPAGLSDVAFTPFGNIICDGDGNICMGVYLSEKEKTFSSFFVRSRDWGKSWTEVIPINPRGDETCLLEIGNGECLAVSREANRLVQFRSKNAGKNWSYECELTLPGQVTGNIMQLCDGRLLLSYGNRNNNNCGIDIRMSDDNGRSWSSPCRLTHLALPDCGYPSTVQLRDGSMVTAYYTQTNNENKYEMHSLKWKIV